MKSFALATTILALTSALVALDLSGAHRAASDTANTSAATRSQARAIPSTSVSQLSALSELSQAQSADAVDDDDEPEPTLFNTFLVTPRATVPVATTVSAPQPVRYD